MENKDYLATFKFYDKYGRRLAIFGQKSGDSVSISIITCSKSDGFCKKRARELYELWEDNDRKHTDVNPITAIFQLKDSQKIGREFIQWCRENYYFYEPINISLEGHILALRNEEGCAQRDNLKVTLKRMMEGVLQAISGRHT